MDGMSLIYRAFHAIAELSTSKGQPTNAIYGVVMTLTKLLKEEKPDYCAFALDRPEPTFRHERFAAYKAHRPPMPDALASQMPWLRKIVEAFRLPILECPGYEADDILATVAIQATQKGMSVVLVTSDKDAMQLLGERVSVLRPTKEGYEKVDQEELNDRWHLRPDQVVDVMALMGDSTDAIPGVPGIGEKTAVALIQEFGSLEKLLANLSSVSGKAKQEAILQHKDRVSLNLELVTLDREVPLAFEWESLRVGEPNRTLLRELYQQFEFRKLLKDPLLAEVPAGGIPVEQISSAAEARDLLSRIREKGRMAFVWAWEETSVHPMQAQGIGVGLAVEEGTSYALPLSVAEEILPALWKDASVLKICPRLKEVMIFMKRFGWEPQGPCTDPELASYLLNPSRPSHALDLLAQEFFGESPEETDPLAKAARTAEAALRLMPVFDREMKEKDLSMLMHEVELPLSAVLAEMEWHGIAVDEKELEKLSGQMRRVLEGLTVEIHRLAGRTFNLNSPKQLAQILFHELKLPVVRRTKTGASTDEEVLRRLSAQHPLPAKILEYRETFKLSSTYVDALPKLIHPQTHRIHASFNQTVTVTGRLSASNPNLQNIPIRTELGRQIRRAFVPSEPGFFFMGADYSQIELRILAHLSHDPTLREAFVHRQDIHRTTAAEIFHVDPKTVTDDQRAAAKTINFGILYGMSPFGLAKELGITPPEAEGFIHRYFARYPKVQEYIQRCLEESRARGYCTTLFHRRRYLPELHASDLMVRQFAERTAINAPIQGSAADLIKIAMVTIHEEMKRQRLMARMLLQVHDELVFEVPEKELPTLRALVEERMVAPTLKGKPFTLSVPITIKVTHGRNWLEASHG